MFFQDLIQQHPEVSIALLQELTQRLRAAGMKIKALSLKDAEGKVATVLLQLADDMGKIKQEIEKYLKKHKYAVADLWELRLLPHLPSEYSWSLFA